MNGSALNFTDLLLAHVLFYPLTTLHKDKIGHVTSDTRPSHFSACNIEMLGMGLGTRLDSFTFTIIIMLFRITLEAIFTLPSPCGIQVCIYVWAA